MSGLSSISTPEALADWLATNPTGEARNHAVDSLIALWGHDRAMTLWSLAIRVNNGREMARIMDRLDDGLRHQLPVVDALRAATGAVFEQAAVRTARAVQTSTGRERS